jgi:hypothetical protein
MLKLRVATTPEQRTSLAYALGWTAHEHGKSRTDRGRNPYSREPAGQWAEEWLAGWDARHRQTLRIAQDEGMKA